MVKINGENVDAAGATLAEQLAKLGCTVERVAVELNGSIVPKARYGDTILHDGDSVEVVSFVGGG